MATIIKLTKHKYCNCYMRKWQWPWQADDKEIICMYSYGRHFITLTKTGRNRNKWTIELISDSPSQTTSKHITWFLAEYCPEITRKMLIKYAGQGPKTLKEVLRNG